jgi:2-polyprenyl-3-methyl-5-hydroxy-6-metoxy-1,4-benzoquinol methylase
MTSEGPRELAPDDPAFDISDSADVAALLTAENKHFWHLARNRYILARLGRLGVSPPARVIDLGCGAGCVARELVRAGYDTTGVDGHRSLIDIARSRSPSAEFHCRDLRRGVSDLPAEAFDVACLFDVIEHLDDPKQALETAMTLARPGGFVVGTVPALMALWSGIDEHAGHKLRYSRATLHQVLAGVEGATIVEVSAFFRSLVPMMWVQRRFIGPRGRPSASVKNLTVPPAPVNAALLALVTLEHIVAPALDKVRVPGASLWFAMKKTA